MNKMTAQELEHSLAGFTGSQQFFSLGFPFPKHLLTEGVMFLAKNAGGGAFGC